jgi:hypothetical protein
MLDTSLEAFDEQEAKKQSTSAVSLILPWDSLQCDVANLEHAGDLLDHEEGMAMVWTHVENLLETPLDVDETDTYAGVLLLPPLGLPDVDLDTTDKVKLIQQMDSDKREDVRVCCTEMSLEIAITGGENKCSQKILQPCPPLHEIKEKATRKNHPKHKVARLKKIFQNNQKPGLSQFLEMSGKLRMTVHQLRMWFNNERKRSCGD